MQIDKPTPADFESGNGNRNNHQDCSESLSFDFSTIGTRAIKAALPLSGALGQIAERVIDEVTNELILPAISSKAAESIGKGAVGAASQRDIPAGATSGGARSGDDTAASLARTVGGGATAEATSAEKAQKNANALDTARGIGNAAAAEAADENAPDSGSELLTPAQRAALKYFNHLRRDYGINPVRDAVRAGVELGRMVRQGTETVRDGLEDAAEYASETAEQIQDWFAPRKVLRRVEHAPQPSTRVRVEKESNRTEARTADKETTPEEARSRNTVKGGIGAPASTAGETDTQRPASPGQAKEGEDF